MKKPVYQYRVEVYPRRRDGKFESRIVKARGENNIIYTSTGQGYNTWQAALRIAKNVFGTGYGVQFFVQKKSGGELEEVRPW